MNILIIYTWNNITSPLVLIIQLQQLSLWEDFEQRSDKTWHELTGAGSLRRKGGGEVGQAQETLLGDRSPRLSTREQQWRWGEVVRAGIFFEGLTRYYILYALFKKKKI